MALPSVPPTEFAPGVCTCPTCAAECKRHSVYVRTIRDISLDGPIILTARVGNYRCPNCRRFFKPELPFAGKGKRYTSRAVRKATVAVQEDKTTYTGLPNRLERDFNVRPAKSTGWAWFQEFAGEIDVEEYLRWACGRFSGQISVDSIEDGGMQTWFATDPLNRDTILGYHRAERADSESLTVFLTDLRDRFGIHPQLFVCDDALVFNSAPQQVWPSMPVQLCHFHVIKLLNYKYLRNSLAARMKAHKPVKPPKEPRPDGRPLPKQSRGFMTAAYVRALLEYGQKQEVWAEMHKKRRLFFKTEANLAKPASVELREAKLLRRWCRLFPELGTFRKFIVAFYKIMSCKEAASATMLRRAFLKKWKPEAEKNELIAYVLKQFADDRWFGRLFPFTAFDNAARTSNSTERANRWFRKRQKTHYRNRKERTIKNMLHADLIYRRNRTPPDEAPNQLRRKLETLQQPA